MAKEHPAKHPQPPLRSTATTTTVAVAAAKEMMSDGDWKEVKGRKTTHTPLPQKKDEQLPMPQWAPQEWPRESQECKNEKQTQKQAVQEQEKTPKQHQQQQQQ